MAQSIDLTVSTVIEHYFFLKTPPRPLEYLGATLIFSAGIMIPFVKAWKATFPDKEDQKPLVQSRKRLSETHNSEEDD
ncbi:Oidioi.mRNA.OKI2018_I69.chr1.g2146.t1.cds [Oikopleura dioica]|uniref:Oidioi.mRNA.OKI2018_I69.chr1.g2146.t1.cds n=1 Tax=Oikopleura dioica TaxID=34765 RepID=A0ABN7SWG8_OIKDI|nr:Oidioi.mRNA.OKI2018_I69.chr1.g2146.t1.cds [Oikopleura dioica]